MHQDNLESAKLVIKNLSISRGEHLLLENLSLTMAPGDTLWITGSNGIGKTSLLKCIAGLLRPEHGNIIWWGRDVHKHPPNHIGYQGHNDSHKANLSVLENLQFWGALYMHKDYDTCLKRVGLDTRINQRAKGLSAGQSRRLSLARLLLKRAKLWVLDEPAACMDMNKPVIVITGKSNKKPAKGRASISGKMANNQWAQIFPST